jgi:hypothetical protein
VRRRERDHVRAVLIRLDCGCDLTGRDVDDEQHLAPLRRHGDFVTTQPGDTVRPSILLQIDRSRRLERGDVDHSQRAAG